MFPNDAAIMGLVGALLIEQNEGWHLTRRYMSQENLAKPVTPLDEQPKKLERRKVAYRTITPPRRVMVAHQLSARQIPGGAIVDRLPRP